MTLSRLEKLFININQGDTPFTLENVRYIKEMAKLMIIALILPTGGGIIFEYGYKLQQDTKAKMYGEVSNNE